eukprot:9605676-Lingulodinium_polyedra.AAC.1
MAVGLTFLRWFGDAMCSAVTPLPKRRQRATFQPLSVEIVKPLGGPHATTRVKPSKSSMTASLCPCGIGQSARAASVACPSLAGTPPVAGCGPLCCGGGEPPVLLGGVRSGM